jgi:hypothetical protein
MERPMKAWKMVALAAGGYLVWRNRLYVKLYWDQIFGPTVAPSSAPTAQPPVIDSIPIPPEDQEPSALPPPPAPTGPKFTPVGPWRGGGLKATPTETKLSAMGNYVRSRR